MTIAVNRDLALKARSNRSIIILATAAGLSTLMAAAAHAQTSSLDIEALRAYNRGRNIAVTERERPDYQAQGVPAGAFRLYPRVDVGVGYSSNILASADDEKAGSYVATAPSLRLASGWSRHSFETAAGLETRDYPSEGGQKERGWFATAAGRFDIIGDSSIQAGAEARRGYDDRLNANTPSDTAKPIRYEAVGAYARGVYQLSRTRLTLSGNVIATDYNDVQSLSGALLDQDFRDETSSKLVGRGEFAVSPDLALFAQAGVGHEAYDRTAPGQQTRDSAETRFLVGANFDLNALMRGEIGVGYLRREYDSPVYGTAKGPAVSSRIEYFPTTLVTVTATAQRSFQDSALANIGGYFANIGTLRADYELLRNVILNARGAWERDTYKGYDREDRLTTGGLGATYLLNRSVGVGADLTYIDRKSSGALAAPDYDALRFALTLTLQR